MIVVAATLVLLLTVKDFLKNQNKFYFLPKYLSAYHAFFYLPNYVIAMYRT